MEESLTGSVVTVLYPYSDLSAVKRRPAVVIAKLSGEEYLLCSVTSQPILHAQGIRLLPDDFASGGLRLTSQVRPDKLFGSHSDIIGSVVGTLQKDYFVEIRERVLDLIRNG